MSVAVIYAYTIMPTHGHLDHSGEHNQSLYCSYDIKVMALPIDTTLNFVNLNCSNWMYQRVL